MKIQAFFSSYLQPLRIDLFFILLFSMIIVGKVDAQSYTEGHSQVEYSHFIKPGLSIKNLQKGVFSSSILSVYNDKNYRVDIGVRSSTYIGGGNRSFISSWNNRPLDFATGLSEVRMSIDSMGRIDITGDRLLLDTVVRINTLVEGLHDVVGISVTSHPDGPDNVYGIGGIFRGGWRGVRGFSIRGVGTEGGSQQGVGVFGTSTSNSAVLGSSTSGAGVKGISSTWYGVEGRSTDSTGVFGFSNNNHGITAMSDKAFYAGLYATSTDNAGYGIIAKAKFQDAIMASSITESGVFGKSDSGSGVEARSTQGTGLSASGKYYGVHANADSTGVFGRSNKYGVHGSGDRSGVIGSSIFGHGVEGHADSGANKFDFYASGPSADWGTSSSRRWKSNIVRIADPIEKLEALRGVTYTWDQAHGGGRHDIGFIAEEVGAIFPEIVSYEKNGIDAIAMDYTKIPALLVEASKAMRSEYISKIDNLKSENTKLLNTIESLHQKLENILTRLEQIENSISQ